MYRLRIWKTFLREDSCVNAIYISGAKQVMCKHYLLLLKHKFQIFEALSYSAFSQMQIEMWKFKTTIIWFTLLTKHKKVFHVYCVALLAL